MDRKIPVSIALLMACILGHPSLALADQAKAQANEAKGTLALPAGQRLDPSKAYPVEINVGEGRVKGTFRIEGGSDKGIGKETSAKTSSGSSASASTDTSKPPAATEAASPAPPNTSMPTPLGRMPYWAWGILGMLLAVALTAGALLYYFRRVLPRRELAPYWRALVDIRNRQFSSALPTLTSIESILPPELRDDARFFIALCHYHLEEYADAEHLAATLHRENPTNGNAAYLLAHLRVKRGLDAEAEPVLLQMRQNGQLSIRDAQRLLGIVKFRRGMAAMRGGDIDAAADFFSEVEELGNFAGFIPADLRNRHVSLGTRALFDRDLAGARQHFQALRVAGSAMDEEKGKSLLAKAEVGLVLADWIEDDVDHGDELDASLGAACRLLHPEGPEELPWPEPEPGSAKGNAESLQRALEAADKNFNLPPEEKGIRRCLRDLHLLRALSLLRLWSRMEGKAANAAIGDRLKATLSRLACARALDERFSDVYLVAGLLIFYLHQPGPERTTGVDLLEEARKLGMRDPDALEILNNRERIERENADAVDRYQQVLDRYLRDETVRQEVRRDLLKRLSTHRSLMNRYKPPDLTRARTVPPTVQEIFNRSATLRDRIQSIRDSSKSEELVQRSEDLKRQSEMLAAQAQSVEASESELLVLTGEELFKDV
jgi:tetratricopeptide (TPR) repeat protein